MSPRPTIRLYKLSFSPHSFSLLPVMVYYFAITVLLVAGCAAPCTGPVPSTKIPGSIQSILSEIRSETGKCKWPGTIVFGSGLLSLVIKICVTTFSCCPWNYCSWKEIKAKDSDCIVHVHLPVEKSARKISKKKRTVKKFPTKFQTKFPTKFKAVNHLPFMVGVFELIKSVSLLCFVVVAVVLVPVADASWLDMTLYKNTAKQHSTKDPTSDHAAKNAVDGNLDTYSRTKNNDDDKWWSIELGEERTVTEIKITHRKGSQTTHARLNGATVFVGNNLDTSSENQNADGTQCGIAICVGNYCQSYIDGGPYITPTAGPFSIVCDPPIKGKMIKIYNKPEWNHPSNHLQLHLADVKVKFSVPATCAQKTDGTNGGSFSCAVGTRLRSNPGNIECGATPCSADSDTENASIN